MAKVTLTADDLFFLSKIMKAKYLDYSYVTMLEDLSHRLAMKEAKAMDNLSNKGLVFEDFTGDLEIEDLAIELFEPIFFGTFESELIIEDSISFQHYKYHVLDGKYVEVEINGKELTVRNIEKEDILMRTPYSEELETKQILPRNYFENVQVEGIAILKRLKIGGSSSVIQLINDAGIYYQAKGIKIHSMTKNELKQLIQKTLWEE